MKKLTFNRPSAKAQSNPKPISGLFGNHQSVPLNKPQIITSLSDPPPSPPEPTPLIIPCLERLTPNKPIKSSPARILYDPASQTKQEWQARQKLLSDQDLGPPPQAYQAKKSINHDARHSTLLARAHNLPIGEASASQYSRVSVEDFGLAMLMGMGFDPKTSPIVQAHQPYRRAFARAGLGAEKGADSPRTKKKKKEREKREMEELDTLKMEESNALKLRTEELRNMESLRNMEELDALKMEESDTLKGEALPSRKMNEAESHKLKGEEWQNRKEPEKEGEAGESHKAGSEDGPQFVPENNEQSDQVVGEKNQMWTTNDAEIKPSRPGSEVLGGKDKVADEGRVATDALQDHL